MVTLPLFYPYEVAGNPFYQQAARDWSSSDKSCKILTKNSLPVDISKLFRLRRVSAITQYKFYATLGRSML
jgi:hypothetical protein